MGRLSQAPVPETKWFAGAVMSATGKFEQSVSSVARPMRTAKRPAPFSIRLSEADRARLLEEAKGAPLRLHPNQGARKPRLTDSELVCFQNLKT